MTKTLEELEQDFSDLYEKISPQIQEKMTAAAKLIDEAQKLSEEHGIPFRPETHIMWCRPSYIPRSLKEKFPELDSDFISDATDAWGGRYPGWQYSQTC